MQEESFSFCPHPPARLCRLSGANNAISSPRMCVWLPRPWLSSGVEYKKKKKKPTDKAGRCVVQGDPGLPAPLRRFLCPPICRPPPLSRGHTTPFQEQKRIFAKATAEARTSLVLEATRAEKFIKSKEGAQVIIWRPLPFSTTTQHSRMEVGRGEGEDGKKNAGKPRPS